MVRELFAAGEFIEVFVDTPIEMCRARDPKGLYRKADRGVDAPYEAPERLEIHLNSGSEPAADLAERVVDYLRSRGVRG